MARAGFVAPHWPAPWGLGAGPTEQLELDLVARGARGPAADEPDRDRLGRTDAARRGHRGAAAAWLPGILDGSELWCQLFSEPGAGSDLSSLTTRAVRDGDEYVVNGQKIWTTLAHVARFGILLARTDPDAEEHNGITYFVVDMRAPGIEVRPIVQMTGTHEFNEVFFTDVRVPAANIVGREHDGWRLAKVTLGNERVSLSGEGALWGRGPDRRTTCCSSCATTAEPSTRSCASDSRRLYIEAEILRLIRLRTVSARVRGLEPGPEASVRKAISDEHGQHVMGMAMELAATHGMCSDLGPYGEPDRAGWHYGYLYARALTIGGGTSEVQRNILGEKVLGLPREP